MKNLITLFTLMLAFNLFAQSNNFKPNEVLVQFTKESNPSELIAKNQNLKAENLELISKTMNIWKIEVNTSDLTENEIIRGLYSEPNVIHAQLNHKMTLRETTPNDPQYPQQWQYYQANDKDIDADLAWDVTTGGFNTDGDEIVAAVIDEGFNINHPDLADNVYINEAEIPGDGIDNDDNGYIDDVNGWNVDENNGDIGDGGWHGTPVSGIIGAVGDNNVGVAGINWNIKVMTIQLSGVFEDDVLKAYDYALQARIKFNETDGEEGAFVVVTNSSWGIDLGQPEDAPLWCEFYDTMGEAGILSAGATANANFNIDEVGDLPTACPSEYMIAVTNMNQNDVKVNQAGYGETTIDLGAPGEGTHTISQNGYGGFGGTSGATPHVAGTIALLYSAPCESFTALSKSDPAMAAQKIRDYIFEGVDPNASLEGITVTGGRLNINNAIELLMDECEVMSVSDQNSNISVEIYPNPVGNQLSINVDGNKFIQKIQIYAMDGKLVKNQHNLISNSVDVSSLPKGVYNIRIQLENQKTVTKKFIKN